METLVDKLVEAHSYIDKSSNITNIVNKLTNKEINLIEHIVEKTNEIILRDMNGETRLIELNLENKIRLLATIYNKSNDIVLYPKGMREEYIQRWSENLGLENFVMRNCLIIGANKIDDIINGYRV